MADEDLVAKTLESAKTLDEINALAAMGKACVDWAENTDDCHFCRRDGDDGSHDDDCLVGDYLRVYRPTS